MRMLIRGVWRVENFGENGVHERVRAKLKPVKSGQTRVTLLLPLTARHEWGEGDGESRAGALEITKDLKAASGKCSAAIHPEDADLFSFRIADEATHDLPVPRATHW